MVIRARACQGHKSDGAACQAPPLRDDDFCLMHSAEHTEQVAEARRLGGLRRRREHAVSGAYEFEGLGSVLQIRRLVEIAAMDTLGLENSIARARTLAYLAQVAIRLLEAAELEERVSALEAATGARS